MFRGIACRRCRARWARDGLAVAVGAVAALSVLAGAPAAADAGEPATPGSSGAACPSPNPPEVLTLVAGTPQTAALEAPFATGLQVALSNSDGCPVTDAAGVAVTFSAPSRGASGLFSASGSSTVTVGSDAVGAAAAPTFTASDTAGSYTVTASSQYGSVSFSLTNTASGIPARVTALAPTSRSATVTHRYPQPLQVRVMDALGNPVAGATVTFALAASPGPGAGACATSATASASFLGDAGAEASATTGASGIATSPPLTANAAAGTFTATATASSVGAGASSGAGDGSSASAGSTIEAGFRLRNLAGGPARLTAGIGATQSAATGTRFPIPLAVTVADAESNPVPDAVVTFAAPAGGPSAAFATRGRGSRHDRPHGSDARSVRVQTDACGIAVAPALTAGRPGGYIVEARAAHARPAAFALVNEQPGQLP
jgi:protocatechuate 3,4-dioxygenase beta subunit